MPTFKPIDRNEHKTHGWKLRTSMIAAQKDSVVPVLITEAPKLLPGYAFAFVKDRNGSLVFVAIQGVHKDDNLYVLPDGRPAFAPTPRHYHAYPFALHEAETEDGNMRTVLLFDHDSGLYRESPEPGNGEKRFFTDDGEVEPDVTKVLEYLKETNKWTKITQKASDALNKAGVLVPWELGIESLDEERPLLKGFFRVDLTKFNELNPEELAELRDAQALTLAYAQLFSIVRLDRLEQLYKLHMEYRQKKDTVAEPTDDLDAFFDGGNETLSVDWSKL